MGPEEEFELHNRQNSWPILFEVHLYSQQRDTWLTVQLAYFQLAFCQSNGSVQSGLHVSRRCCISCAATYAIMLCAIVQSNTRRCFGYVQSRFVPILYRAALCLHITLHHMEKTEASLKGLCIREMTE